MSRKAFGLGCLSGGSLYVFAALGDFATHAAAVAHYNASERNARESAVTVETIPCVRLGVEYGYRKVVRDLRGAVLDI